MSLQGSPSVFYSFHTEDKSLQGELERHLGPLMRQQGLRGWHQGLIQAGEMLRQRVDAHIEQADFVLVLISPEYLANAETYAELEQALLRHRSAAAHIIPILVRPADWRETPLRDLEVLPQGGRAVSLWASRDEAWQQIAERIGQLFRDQRQPTPAARLQPPVPGRRYDPSWYVHRPREEDPALRFLRGGKPVILWGPRRAGKSWLLYRVMHRWREEGGPNSRLVTVGLRAFDSECRRNYDRFTRELAQVICAALSQDPAVVHAAWLGGASPSFKLGQVLKSLLPQAPTPLLVGLDDADILADSPFRDDFFHLLRAWADDPDDPWPTLRLLVAASTVRLNSRYRSSPFENLSEPIAMDELDCSQVADLVRRHGLGWSPSEITALMELVGGHPLLNSAIMYEAAQGGRMLADLLSNPGAIGLLSQHLDSLRVALEQDTALTAAVRRAVDGDGKIERRAFEHLHQLGILTYGPAGMPRLSCRLYQCLLQGQP